MGPRAGKNISEDVGRVRTRKNPIIDDHSWEHYYKKKLSLGLAPFHIVLVYLCSCKDRGTIK